MPLLPVSNKSFTGYERKEPHRPKGKFTAQFRIIINHDRKLDYCNVIPMFFIYFDKSHQYHVKCLYFKPTMIK